VERQLIEGMVIQVLPPDRVVISQGRIDGVTDAMVFAVRFARSGEAPEKCRVQVISVERHQTVCEATASPLPNIVGPGDYVHELPADQR
jgi:hypothetical protein